MTNQLVLDWENLGALVLDRKNLGALLVRELPVEGQGVFGQHQSHLQLTGFLQVGLVNRFPGLDSQVLEWMGKALTTCRNLKFQFPDYFSVGKNLVHVIPGKRQCPKYLNFLPCRALTFSTTAPHYHTSLAHGLNEHKVQKDLTLLRP